MEIKNEEKSIVKAISVLGGTQVCNIVVGIVRNKAISLILGAAGMGVMALYQSTSDIITTISNMGITTTSIKNISKANSENDKERIGYVSSAFRKLVVLTGLLAAVISIVFSPLLSYINFGDYAHIPQFILLAFSLWGLQLVAGYTALLQGCREYKKMSAATLTGNILGLFVCIPLYYFFGFSAIVPVLVIYPLINYSILWRITKKLEIPHFNVCYKEALSYGKDIIKTGFFICLQSLFALLYIYALRLYLSSKGGLELIGLFSAGMLIVNKYVGLVFSSMGTEYYPRLSAVSNLDLFNQGINSQIKRSVLLLCPLVISMIVAMPLVVKILYSEEFLPIVGMSVCLLGSVGFKIIEWCIGFAFIAKGKTKLLFCNEVSFKIYTFVISIIMFNYYGLLGIGIAYLVSEVAFSIQSLLLAKRIWGLTLNKDCLLSYVPEAVCILVCMFASFHASLPLKLLVYTLSFGYSGYMLFVYLKKIK